MITKINFSEILIALNAYVTAANDEDNYEHHMQFADLACIAGADVTVDGEIETIYDNDYRVVGVQIFGIKMIPAKNSHR